MTRKELEAVPHRKWSENTVCVSLIVIPQRSKHDSGYRNMAFVAVDENSYPICKIGGGSDVIHLDGIGGCGKKVLDILAHIPIKAWSIDSLPKSGLLNIFSRYKLEAGSALSSFELYSLNGIDR